MKKLIAHISITILAILAIFLSALEILPMSLPNNGCNTLNNPLCVLVYALDHFSLIVAIFGLVMYQQFIKKNQNLWFYTLHLVTLIFIARLIVAVF